MKLAVVAASLSLSALLVGCATAADLEGSGTGIDSGSVAFDSGGDISVGKDTGVAQKDSAVASKDTATPTDTGTSTDTASGVDSNPGTDSNLPDTAIDDTATTEPDTTGAPGTCAVDKDCTTPPLNCCDTTSGKCSLLWIFICLPAS